MIPVIDIFAGPGGLAEGFSSVLTNDQRRFSIRLSIEMEDYAFQTLQLRSFFRQFPPGEAPHEYYRFVKGEIPLESLYRAWPGEAALAIKETWKKKLGKLKHESLDKRIHYALAGNTNWCLIGGPPCQAYSNAGMVGNRTKDGYAAEKDERSYLYKEYIRIIAKHHPALFVLENVPGMLSAKLNGKKIIGSIIDGLINPSQSVHKDFGLHIDSPKYKLLSLNDTTTWKENDPRQYIVRCERIGLPQARHRVIIIGVREEIETPHYTPLEDTDQTSVEHVLADLPPLRSYLSKETDTLSKWRRVFSTVRNSTWLGQVRRSYGRRIASDIASQALALTTMSPETNGAEYLDTMSEPTWNPDWYRDEKLEGLLHHQARPHINSDLHRYLFVSSFSAWFGRSPKLHEFPDALLPDHQNADSGNFKDRFRTILPYAPSKTIISHLAKDGHAFIHYDPLQCRSLTPREAARIQTFPDNYYFFGGRAAQFRQIGNAVPPWLAKLVAQKALNILRPA